MQNFAPQPTSAVREGYARVGGREGRVSVSDLTDRGCRIATSNGFVASGEDIILKLDDIRVIGRVSGCDGRDATVKFRNALHEAMVAHLGFEAPRQTPTCLTAVHGEPNPSLLRSRVLRSLADVVSFFSLP